MNSQETEAGNPLLAEDERNTEKGLSLIAESGESHRLSDYKVEAWR